MKRLCSQCQKKREASTGIVRADDSWICHGCLERYLDPTGVLPASCPPGCTPKAKRKGKPKEPGFPLPVPYAKKVQGLKEADVLKQVLGFLSTHGLWHKRIEVSGVRRGGKQMTPSKMTGMADILASLPVHTDDGRTIAQAWWIEVKAPGGELSADQARFLSDAQTAGCRCDIVASIEGMERLYGLAVNNAVCIPVESIGSISVW